MGCFRSHIFAIGVLDAQTVVVGNDRDLQVEVVATFDAQLYTRPSNSNTTVFDITMLPNSVGKCKIVCSPYTLWLGVTLPRSYNQGKNIICRLFKEHTCLAKDYQLSIYPRLPHRISTDIKFCYICMVSQILPHQMHLDTSHIHMPWWENLSMTTSN